MEKLGIVKLWYLCYDALERKIMDAMSKYTNQDVRSYIRDIRLLLTESVEEMTDEKAMGIIETFVFSQDKSASCSFRDNAALIERLFL